MKCLFPISEVAARVEGTVIRRVAGDLVYYCWLCKDGVSAPFGSPDDVRHHCQQEHSSKRSRFIAAETVVCNICGALGTCLELVNHHKKEHPDEQSTAYSGINRARCAPSIRSLWNNLFVSRENLAKLFAGEQNGNKVSYFVCCCRQIIKHNLMEHVQEHGVKCHFCDFKSDEVCDMLVHLRESHEFYDFQGYFEGFQKTRKKEIFQSNVLYGNGLVLTYGSLDETPYNPIPSIHKPIEDWVATLKHDYILKKRHQTVFKVIVPYVRGENIKSIFLNLRIRLGIEIDTMNKSGFVDIKRSASKRSIIVECKTAKMKEIFKEKFKQQIVFANELIDSGYNLPADLHPQVQFEF